MVLSSYKQIYLNPMNKDEFQNRILLKQNTELASKVLVYRRENQQLKRKNEEMNVWVQNFGQVFAGIASAWQNVTSMEEYLYTLMKKKSDLKDKTVINKYIAHFKTFPDIVENLAQKIQNTGHSNQATLDAKERLASFVKNYEMFFKDFVETYFKFNQENSKWLETLQNQPDLPQIAKASMAKDLENRQRIKDFEAYAAKFQQAFKTYQAFNQHKLLDGLLLKKEQEIAQLKLQNMRQARRLRVIMDYNPQSIQKLIENLQNQNYFECNCGGAQINFLKTLREQNSKNLIVRGKSISEKEIKQQMDVQNERNVSNHQEINLLKSQINRLKERNARILDKLQKNKVQNKLTEEMVIRSNSYILLKKQCQHLINYSNDLMGRLRKQSEFLDDLQRNKNDEMRDLKRKFQKQYGQINSQTSIVNANVAPQNTKIIQIFKSQTIKLIQELKNSFDGLNEKEVKVDAMMAKNKNLIQGLKKENEDLSKKIMQYKNAEVMKADKFQFKHQKYRQIQESIEQILEKVEGREQLKSNWRQFLMYFKSRDKKIREIESMLKKKDKQLSQKQKMEEMFKQELLQTQMIYENNKKKLDCFNQFTKKVQQELSRLVQENFNLKTIYDQEKASYQNRLKLEIEARLKIQVKLQSYQKIDDQIAEFKKLQEDLVKKFNEAIIQKNQKLEHMELQSNQKSVDIDNLREQCNQKQKIIMKLNTEKQGLKSEVSKAQRRFSDISEKSEHQEIIKELNYYKGKVMCSICTGDRERELALKTCPHFFCRRCIEETLNNRNRKCPVCNVKFGKVDVHQIKWV